MTIKTRLCAKSEKLMDIRQEITEKAPSLGIYQCGFVSTAEINVSPMVRTMCEKNVCGAYGKTWACPPGVGDIDECLRRMRAFTTAFHFSTRHELEDSYDFEGMTDGKKAHEAIVPGVVAFFREKFGKDMMVLSTEGCRRCPKCTYPDAPCRFPDRAFTSMEAYGLLVTDVCKSADTPYYYGKNTVTFTSCVRFK